MFWKKKPKKSEKPSREELFAELKENSRKAAEAIGEDTLDKVRAQMAQKENSPFERALKQVKSMDKERIADNIRATYRDE